MTPRWAAAAAPWGGGGPGTAAASGPGTPGGSGHARRIHLLWFSGMSCDGCTVALTAAGNPPLEKLLTSRFGSIEVVLHHPFFAQEWGHDFLEPYVQALRGELDGPHVVVLEGSATDESLAGEGHWASLGGVADEASNPGPGDGRPVATMDWIRALAPSALAAVAVGTCASWGGVPAAVGNVTGAMSLSDLLGREYRGVAGLPVVNVPGCAPVPDNLMETLSALLLFLQGTGPEPELDDMGRPAWLYTETVHRNCVRAGYYEEGRFARAPGQAGCLVEMGCWGPVVQCNITSRGAAGGLGGCMNAGGACIGCTMPGFPDKFSPFYASPATAAFTAGEAGKLPLHRLPVVTASSVASPLLAPAGAAAVSGWNFDTSSEPHVYGTSFYELWRVRDLDEEASLCAGTTDA